MAIGLEVITPPEIFSSQDEMDARIRKLLDDPGLRELPPGKHNIPETGQQLRVSSQGTGKLRNLNNLFEKPISISPSNDRVVVGHHIEEIDLWVLYAVAGYFEVE